MPRLDCRNLSDGLCLGFYLVVLFNSLGGALAGQRTADARVGIEERVYTGSKVYSLLEAHFSSATPNSDDSYKNYLHKILATDDRRLFDLATIEFVARQHSGHTFFWDTWLDKSNNEPLGFYAKPLDGRWVVQSSSVDNLKPGDIIASIDDTATEAFFLQQQRYISASTRAAQRRNLFLLPYLFPERLTLTLGDGRKLTINRATLTKPADRTEGQWLKRNEVAYISIPSFFDLSREQEALEYLRQFYKASTLIIDVRNNPGGIPPLRLIRNLMDRPYRGWADSTTKVNAVHQAAEKVADDSRGVPDRGCDSLANSKSTRDNRVTNPSPNAFRGRLILLVDGGCVSACEDLVEPFKESGRAILVGETTQGSSGLPFIYDFHNGMSLRIAVKRYYFPDGSEFEGVGIKPDIEVHTTIEDLKNGRDPVLEKVLELAGKP